MDKNLPLVLSLYPNMRGFGYVCVEWPKTLIDEGIATIRPLSNLMLLNRVKRFIQFHKPNIVVIRGYIGTSSKKLTRAQILIQQIIDYAREKQLPVFSYTRENIQSHFAYYGAQTKDEIAKQILVWFPELKCRAPKLRKPWMEEDYNMGIFDAMALAITHQNLVTDNGPSINT